MKDDYEGFSPVKDGWEDYVGFGESITKEWA